MPIPRLPRRAKRAVPLKRVAILLSAGLLATGAAAPSCEAPPPPIARNVTLVPPPVSFVTKDPRLGVGGCPLFPANNVFHAAVRKLPVLPQSGSLIASNPQLEVHPGFYSLIWQGSAGGLPVNVVDSRTAVTAVMKLGLWNHPPSQVTFPVPSDPRFEGWPSIIWDRHLLVVDKATCTSHEFFYVVPPWQSLTGEWQAEGGGSVDLRSNAMPPRPVTSSQFSLLAGMVRYDEVAAGAVNHTIGISLPTISNQEPIWPANGTDGRSDAANAPRTGEWFRLRADVDISSFGPQARVVAQALKDHGALVTDTGPEWISLGGETDPRWDDDDLAALARLHLSDFEAIDASPMKVSETTHEIR